MQTPAMLITPISTPLDNPNLELFSFLRTIPGIRPLPSMPWIRYLRFHSPSPRFARDFSLFSIAITHQLRDLIKQLLQIVVRDLIRETRDERLCLLGAIAAQGACEKLVSCASNAGWSAAEFVILRLGTYRVGRARISLVPCVRRAGAPRLRRSLFV
jgi:hypothetical protein